jgi:ATP-binding cassette subfamily C (CFTR/MRP) protein 1
MKTMMAASQQPFLADAVNINTTTSSYLTATPSSQSLLSYAIRDSGSLSGYRHQILQLGSDYLSAERKNPHPLCGNKEGWGPLSQERYDFTPCFMDVWVSSVAVFGILFGSVAVWWLVKKKNTFEVGRNWHFWSKMVCYAFSFRWMLR